MFQGISDIDQMAQIGNYLGTPNPTNWKDIETMPDYGKIIFNQQDPVKDFFKIDHPLVGILDRMLRYSAGERITCAELKKIFS